MATFNIAFPGSIACPDKGNVMIGAGDYLRLTLDDAKLPNLEKEVIDALINSLTPAQVRDPETNTLVDGYIYNVTVDDNDMPVVDGQPMTELDPCDVLEAACKSCCDELSDRMDDLEATAGTTYWIDGPVAPGSDPDLGEIAPGEQDTVAQVNTDGNVEFWTYDGAAWQLDFTIPVGSNFNFNVTSGDSPTDTSGGTAVVAAGQTLHLWSAGGLSAQTVSGSAKIQIEPANITAAALVDGAPGSAPKDQSRPAIHFAQDGIYFWDPGSTSWKAVVIDRTADTYVVDTAIAGLQSLTGLSDGAVVVTKGYRTQGDSGANTYRYVSTSTDPCDGGFIFDGPGGDNSLAESSAIYAGTPLVGRFLALDKKLVTAAQFGLSAPGTPAVRETAMVTSTNAETDLATLNGRLWMRNSNAPAGEFDPSQGGELTWDNDFLYFRNNTRWRKIALSSFSTGSPIAGTFAYDPPQLADGSGTTAQFALAGVALGDHTWASFDQPLQGVLVRSSVNAAGVVDVRFQNESGSVVDLPAGNVSIVASSSTAVPIDPAEQLVDVVADLENIPSLTDGQTVRTLGYNTIRDGGGNLYQYVAASADACDGGFILDGLGGDNSQAATNASYPGTGTGRFVAVDQTVANAKQFGARGDGVTDDTFRLQAAISSGKPVDVLSGTYPVSTAITYTGDLEMSGSGSPTILFSGTGILDITGAAQVKGVAFSGGDVTTIDRLLKITITGPTLIEGCEFVDMDSATFAQALTINGTGESITVRNCKFAGIKALANSVVGDTNGSARGIYFGTPNTVNTITIAGCVFDGINSVASNGGGANVPEDADAVQVTDSVAIDNINVLGCHFENVGKRALKLSSGDDVLIQGCTVKSSWTGLDPSPPNEALGMFGAIGSTTNDVKRVRVDGCSAIGGNSNYFISCSASEELAISNCVYSPEYHDAVDPSGSGANTQFFAFIDTPSTRFENVDISNCHRALNTQNGGVGERISIESCHWVYYSNGTVVWSGMAVKASNSSFIQDPLSGATTAYGFSMIDGFKSGTFQGCNFDAFRDGVLINAQTVDDWWVTVSDCIDDGVTRAPVRMQDDALARLFEVSNSWGPASGATLDANRVEDTAANIADAINQGIIPNDKDAVLAKETDGANRVFLMTNDGGTIKQIELT